MSDNEERRDIRHEGGETRNEAFRQSELERCERESGAGGGESKPTEYRAASNPPAGRPKADDVGRLIPSSIRPEDFYLLKKKCVLYKECQIAGTAFHDLGDTWKELYVGAELALVREKRNKYDKNAVAVALAGDYDGDPDNFDFDFILGYVPQAENEHLAAMMDMGWDEAFVCELSHIDGPNSRKGTLWMKIFIVSRYEYDTSGLVRLIELSQVECSSFVQGLETQGFAYFRWRTCAPTEEERTTLKKGERVVVMLRLADRTLLYLMHCIADNDDDAAFFNGVEFPVYRVDERQDFILTNIKGPVSVANKELTFIADGEIGVGKPGDFLSVKSSEKLRRLIDNATEV